MTADWNRSLTRLIEIDEGDSLVSLNDALCYLRGRLWNDTSKPSVELAVALLARAASSGTWNDRQSATIQLASCLRPRLPSRIGRPVDRPEQRAPDKRPKEQAPERSAASAGTAPRKHQPAA